MFVSRLIFFIKKNGMPIFARLKNAQFSDDFFSVFFVDLFGDIVALFFFFSVEELAHVLLTKVVAVQLWGAVQRSPLGLILEESHGMHILRDGMSQYGCFSSWLHDSLCG